MGVFKETVRVGNPRGGDFLEIAALVDTRAAAFMFPRSLLGEIHLQPLASYLYAVADGRKMEFPYGQAIIEINGTARICPVIFGPEDEALLGATTLEIFKLVADPVNQALSPATFTPLGWGGRA